MDTIMSTAPLGTATPVAGTGEYTLRFEREYGHPEETVWRYLSEPIKTRLWWAESRIEPHAGGRFDLRWLNGEDRYPLEWWRGRVEAYEPTTLLEHSNEVHGMLRWQLAATTTGAALTFTNTISPPEPHLVTMSLAGWHLHLEHLGAALDGAVIDWPHWHRDFSAHFDDVHARYRKATGLP